MKIRELMTDAVIQADPDMTVSAAAKTLTHYNIGALPVCTADGALCGMVTDRDIVTRCLASGISPEKTTLRQIMTAGVVSAQPDMEVGVAAHLMGRQQVRRLPVVENGKLCGMVSLGDLANQEETNPDAADALGDICNNISQW